MTTTPHDKAMAAFTEYFVRNYPGPDTVIFDPKWHAPKLFNAAMKAIEAASAIPEAGNGDGWMPIETAPKDGTRILTWQPTEASAPEAINHWDGTKWIEDNGSWFVILPEFWRPLPPPPSISNDKGREG